MSEFEEAIERVVAGLEEKNRLINAYEKAHDILDAKKNLLKKSAEMLLEKETIEGDALKQLSAENQPA